MTKKYKTNHAEEGLKQQHCPTCNRYIKYIAGHPAYICTRCIERARDKDEKEILFKSITDQEAEYKEFTKQLENFTAQESVISKGLNVRLKKQILAL